MRSEQEVRRERDEFANALEERYSGELEAIVDVLNWVLSETTNLDVYKEV